MPTSGEFFKNVDEESLRSPPDRTPDLLQMFSKTGARARLSMDGVQPCEITWMLAIVAKNRRIEMVFSIEQMVADCLSAVQDTGGSPGAAVEQVLSRAVSTPAAIEEVVGQRQDLPVITPWFNSYELTVLHIVWPPEVNLMAHDHLMWAAIGLYGGREENQVFRPLPDGNLEHRQTRTLRRGDTIVLGDDAVHAVANPSREWTGAIHVYGGDFFRGGKHMWPQPEQSAVPYDVDVVRRTLNEAATHARASTPTPSSEPTAVGYGPQHGTIRA